MAANDYIAPILAKLTSNGAITLWGSIKHPHKVDPGMCGRMFTGSGKYTTLAHIGVANHLKKLGLAEERMWGQSNPWDKGHPVLFWTPLGREVAQYLHDHWEDHIGTFREGSRNA